MLIFSWIAAGKVPAGDARASVPKARVQAGEPLERAGNYTPDDRKSRALKARLPRVFGGT
jgi:hypothetical protein